MTSLLPLPDPLTIDADLLQSMRFIRDEQDDQRTGALAVHVSKIEALTKKELIHPLVYAYYRELTISLAASELKETLVFPGVDHVGLGLSGWKPIATNSFEVVSADCPDSPYSTAGFEKLLNEGTAGRLKLAAVMQEELEVSRNQIERALSLWRQFDSAGYHRWLSIIRQIVFVNVAPESEITLGGASSLFLPGVVILSVNTDLTDLEVLVSLVHESCHTHLNMLCQFEALTLNEAGEVFVSPLRGDARPMEGIIHATYVCSEVTETMRALSRRPPDERLAREAATKIETLRSLTADGLSVITPNARLTATGDMVVRCIRERLSQLVIDDL